MMLPLTLIDLAGSVALLLWGVHMVQTGMQRAFGARLHSFLGSALRRRLPAFFAGIAATAVLQSSSQAAMYRLERKTAETARVADLVTFDTSQM